MKKKIFMLAAAACLIVLSIVGSSLAYFTAVDDASTVFTAGNVAITLDLNTDNVDDNFFPGQEYTAPAKITNTGSEAAYVGAIITLSKNGGISDILADAKDTDNIPAAIADVLSVSNGTAVKYEAVANGYKVYVVFDSSIAKNEFIDFNGVIDIPAEWNNDEMAIFNGISYEVVAYATQTVGFTDAKDALAKAFPTVWAAALSVNP